MAAKQVLYDIPVSNNGARCRIAIYAKGLEDKIDIVSPSELGGIKSEEYMKLNPYGKMPLFTTGDDNIYESEVILQYILDKYADVGMNLSLATPEERAHSALCTKIFDTYMQPIQGCMYRKAESAEERAAQLKVIDENLHILEAMCSDGGPYFCGSQPSGADCGLFPSFVFFQFMLEEQFGWADAFYDKPLLKKWYNYLKKSDGSEFTKCTERVYGEIFDALKDWESNGRWEVQGIKAHLQEDFKW
eukprot:CAMPEP_0197469660 /NCGR_PEP_ID=MMETSP1309-20131121/119_1 /TAXON_ID=464262 /ORGANISM="Genus nov. species nov., Strain RCC998" /LENGTH=245 /DNA_ID=CAMNT_0043005869 /DNA_START=183 /DNA_END=917 /DNA_ORIENTATION=-